MAAVRIPHVLRLAPLVALAVSAVCACSAEPATAIILVADVDAQLLALDEPVTRVKFVIRPPGGGMEDAVYSGKEFPAYLTLQHRSGSPLEGYEVLVQGLPAEGGAVVEREAVVAFKKGETRVAELHLSAKCLSGAPQCPQDQVCTHQQERCQDKALADGDYGEYWGADGTIPGFDTGGDAGSTTGDDAGSSTGEDAGQDAAPVSCDPSAEPTCETRDGTEFHVVCDADGVEQATPCDGGEAGAPLCQKAVCDPAMGCIFEADSSQDGEVSCQASGSPLSCMNGVCGGANDCTDNSCSSTCDATVASCRIPCGESPTCTATCDGTENCEFDCTQSPQTNNACKAQCLNGAACVLYCKTSDCNFSSCTDGTGATVNQEVCPDDPTVVTCNGAPCPEPA